MIISYEPDIIIYTHIDKDSRGFDLRTNLLSILIKFGDGFYINWTINDIDTHIEHLKEFKERWNLNK